MTLTRCMRPNCLQEVERPTVILAMTVKGYGTSEAGEASNETHSLKKLDLKVCRHSVTGSAFDRAKI